MRHRDSPDERAGPRRFGGLEQRGLIKRAGGERRRAARAVGGSGGKRVRYATTRGYREAVGTRGVCRDREARTHNAPFAV